MARSTFYYSRFPKQDKWAVERIRIAELYHENKGRYGYRRLQSAMRNEGYLLSGKTVRRLMSEAGIKCEVRMKKYRSYKGTVGQIAPNLLNRDFHSDKPHKKLVTDVTEFHLFGTKLYLSPVLDLYNGELVSYTIYERPVLDMVMEMMRRTLNVIGEKTHAILHSDQGWQYQHKDYQRLLKENNLIQSMSRKGNCLDNAVVLLQGSADCQMHRFRRRKTGGFIREGLWKHARHPNYLGEILMWWGVALATVCLFPSAWYLCAGALANTLLFCAVSIPMAERKQSKKPGFAAYKAQTRVLLPVPKKQKENA